MNFNIELALQLVNSNQQFPVDFDLAWQWLGFSRKDNAKRSLIESGFVVDVDLRINEEMGTLAVPRPDERIMLTLECFKSWGMMAGTEQGKQVRRYFLECERQFNILSYSQSINSNEVGLETLVKLSAVIVDNTFAGVNLKAEILASLKLNAAESLVPELIPHLKSARQMLINNTATEHKLLTATELGQRLGISAQAVNKRLVELGLQTKNSNKKSKKDTSYVACGQGLEFSDLTLATGMGKDNTTYQQLRWYDSVLSMV